MRDRFADLPKALAHWETRDPIMARLARERPPSERRAGPTSGLASLVVALLHQQVSLAAGQSITRKLLSACGGRFTADALLSLSPARYRTAGVSRQKRSYLVDLARRVASRQIDFRSLARSDDTTVIEALTQVRGIGVWTAKMFLMFHLARPDVVAPEDLGLRIAAAKAYRVPMARAARVLERQAPLWSPFGSLACYTLWNHKDAKD